MKEDSTRYGNVMSVAYLYGAPAQLVAHADSGINSTLDLVGKKVGVGNAGSGAFANCELFFTHLGIWDKIERNAMGYNDAASAFGNKQLDAFWLFTAYPSGAVIMAAQTNDIVLLDVAKDAEESGYFKKYPYFGKLDIPANTYKGVDYSVPSFFDAALWVVNKNVPEDMVYKLLSIIYTEEGLAYMASQNSNFKSMSVQNGVKGIIYPIASRRGEILERTRGSFKIIYPKQPTCQVSRQNGYFGLPPPIFIVEDFYIVSGKPNCW